MNSQNNPPTPGEIEIANLIKSLREGLAHDKPESCWSTGPMTGNKPSQIFEDLIVCPGCRALAAVTQLEKKLTQTAALRQEVEEAKKEAATNFAGIPAKCPITQREFFMMIEHPDLGMVPTYGGPFDSYTIPEIDGEPGKPWHEYGLVCHRYDHDEGSWRIGEVEDVGMHLISDHALVEFQCAQDKLTLAKLKIEELEAACAVKHNALKKLHKHCQEDCNVYFEQDGKPIEISTNLGEAYGESGMADEVADALRTTIGAEVIAERERFRIALTRIYNYSFSRTSAVEVAVSMQEVALEALTPTAKEGRVG